MGITRWFGDQYRKPTGLFAKMIGRQMNGHHENLTRWMLTVMDIGPTDNFLDVCCGGGMALEIVANVATKGEIVGIDYSDAMVEMASRRNTKRIAAGSIKVLNSSVSALPFDNEYFDRAWSVEAFYFWPDHAASLSEIRRVLKPGGRFAIALEWSKNSTNYNSISKLAQRMNTPLHSANEIAALLEQSGFDKIRYDFDEKKNWLLVYGDNPA